VPRGRKPSAAGALTTEQAQARYLEARREGRSNAEAMAAAQRGVKTLEYWRKTNPAFKALAEQASGAAAAHEGGDRSISFPDFCEQYLGLTLFWHQLQWVDLIEGREPRDLHPSQDYRRGDKARLVINTPPFHAKSMTLSMCYVTYRICMDPTVRVLLVSKSQGMAQKFLTVVKAHLRNASYRRLQADFGPQGGFYANAEEWSKTQIRVGSTAGTEDEEVVEKDPTVQAVGIGGHIYGARADLIIVDDGVDRSNAHNAKAQADWLHTEVDSRIEEESGLCLVIGTRIAPGDLYSVLRDGVDDDEAEDEETERPWGYLSQPAVLEFDDDPKKWLTTWPLTNIPWKPGMPELEPGLFERWSGPRLMKKRRKGARIWALVYQQQDVAEDATFGARLVKAAVMGSRKVGPMSAGAMGHRREGMDGLHVIGSIDPSGSKQTAFLVYAVDRKTKKRYVLQAKVLFPWTWPEVRATIRDWTETLGIHEWIVEKNMYHASLVHDEQIMDYLRDRGVRVREHYTGSNKHDVDLGVIGMAPLFDGDDDTRLIELPSTAHNHAAQALVEQLITWQSNKPKNQKDDLVMALWFAELRARELTSSLANRPSHLTNRYASARQRAGQGVVSIQDYKKAVGQ